MEPAKYELSREQKKYFTSVLLMDIIVNEDVIFPVHLENDEVLLEPLLIHMGSYGWVKVTEEGYVPTDAGRKMLLNHKEKLVEFRTLYKIYSAVDLGEGKFAYERYFDFDTDEEFIEFTNESQFEDMRVAVCEFKKINPLEVIFLEMVDSGQLNFVGDNWIKDLLNTPKWDEIVSIANSNIHVAQLEETDEQGNVTATGEDVMEIMLKEGAKISIGLLKQQQLNDKAAEEQAAQEENDETVETTTTTTETTTEYVDEPYYDYSYYDSYYDPYYISPCWLLLWY